MSTEPLTVRFTSTGVRVVEGDCPHCGHAAMDHWSDGCKAPRTDDHCRMDSDKLAALVPEVDQRIAYFTGEAGNRKPDFGVFRGR